nr:MAG TPA: protein of unknown function DUF1540 [Caudoviricetes sp.]
MPLNRVIYSVAIKESRNGNNMPIKYKTTVIKCDSKQCLNNKRGYCQATVIHVIRNHHKCADYITVNGCRNTSRYGGKEKR